MKKNAVKKVMAVVAATMMMTALPVSAQAATWKEGTYKNVTANLYIPKKANPVKPNEWDAYFTSTLPVPRFAASKNATVEVTSAGKITVTIENFGVSTSDGKGLSLVSMDKKSSDGKAEFQGEETVSIGCETDGHNLERYSQVKFEINDPIAAETKEYTFAHAESHAKAKLSLLGIDNDSVQSTVAKLSIDLSSAVQE